MRLEARFAIADRRLAYERRDIERSGQFQQTVAPRAWPNARVEAWLAWADTLATDYPVGPLPEGLAGDAAFDPALGGGPDRYARRLAAWGWALGRFEDEDDALVFRAELFALLAEGLASPAAAPAFGGRLHPLVADPAASPPLPDFSAHH